MDVITLEYHELINKKVEKKELIFSRHLLQEPYHINSLSVIKVEGESMQPLIFDAALVVVDLSQRDVLHQGIYILEHDNKMWIKQAKIENDIISFVSINEKFKHLVYPYEEVRIIGKSLLTFTNL